MESIGRAVNSALQLSKRGGGVAFTLQPARGRGADQAHRKPVFWGGAGDEDAGGTPSPMPISSAPARARCGLAACSPSRYFTLS
ncbi:hypothetical protein LNP74_20790 [Klebsiella pneumoniae subsp. pneumoniae]|nr:hypothetical protein [Klebsiella pneumoniae subsp. pneumoniae]